MIDPTHRAESEKEKGNKQATFQVSQTDISATASVVPYRAYKTADTNITIGGCNDKLYGILCDKLNKPAWKTDPRFLSNALRVENRDTLDRLIEDELKTKTTQEWLEVFEGSGMPYAAVNDIQGTLNHEHGVFFPPFLSLSLSFHRLIL